MSVSLVRSSNSSKTAWGRLGCIVLRVSIFAISFGGILSAMS